MISPGKWQSYIDLLKKPQASGQTELQILYLKVPKLSFKNQSCWSCLNGGCPGLGLVLGSLLLSVHTHSLGDPVQVHCLSVIHVLMPLKFMSMARTTSATTTTLSEPLTSPSSLNYSNKLLTYLFQTILNAAGRTVLEK